MTSKQKKMLYRIITAFVLFVVLMVLEHTGVLEQLPSQWLVFLIYLIPYLVMTLSIRQSETSVTDRCLMKTF